jgi:1,5-anhydro-D-fructose reductase (1,5-anhydro-D-mannitol-forming)
MVKMGIIGLGMMGQMHFNFYKSVNEVKVTAVCDIDENKLKSSGGVAGNISSGENILDLTGIRLYTDLDKMLADGDLDAVTIVVPTYAHADCTIKALKAGLHVFCEKPMALDVPQCRKMIAAANRSGKILQIGHCIRFWPEYIKTKEIIDSGEYGKVLAASFHRLSKPGTWNDWMNIGEKSGGALLDLHIHDADFIQYAFGIPKAVFCCGVKGSGGGYDHVAASYIYDKNMVITAEGGWMMAPGYGFEMSFKVVLEKATIVYGRTSNPVFKICPVQGEVIVPEVDKRGGHLLELIHFINAVQGKPVPAVLTPEDSLNSVRICLAEKASIEKERKVSI